MSLGYLIAAAGTTLATLAGYAVLLAARLARARARNAELRDEHPLRDE